MELADVELLAERLLGLLTDAQPDDLADHVAAGLARPNDVAFDLGDRAAFLVAHGLGHVLDGLLAAPLLVVHAGVDHQAHGAEQGVVQHADLAARVVLVDAHLDGQLLGIERPTLGIAREADDLADQRQALGLVRQRQLQVVARDALVHRQGGQSVLGLLGRVAQVDPVDPRTLAVERGRVVVAARRAGLDGLGHATDLQRRLGQLAEIGRQLLFDPLGLGVQVSDQLFLGRVGVGIDVLAQFAHPVADRALGHADLLEQLVGLGLDRLDHVQAQLVDLVRRQGRGRVVLQRHRVVVGAALQAPNAGVVSSLAADAFHQGDLALQGRQDRVQIDLGRLARPIAGDVLFLGAAGDRLDQRRFGRRGVGEGLHLDQGLVDDEVRRDHAVGDVALGDQGLLIHQAREALHPLQIGVGVGLGLDGVLGVQEVGHLLVAARQLAQHVGRARTATRIGELAIALVLDGQGELDRVVVDRVHARQGLAVDGAQFGELGAGLGGAGRDRLERAVAQQALGPGQVVLVQTQARGQLRRLAQQLGHGRVEERIHLGGLAALSQGDRRQTTGGREARGGSGEHHLATIEQGFPSQAHYLEAKA